MRCTKTNKSSTTKAIILLITFLFCSLTLSALFFPNIYKASATSSSTSSSRVDDIYNSMTPKQRIAQMFMVQMRDWKGEGAVTTLDDDLKTIYSEYQFGGFIAFAANMQNTIDTLNMSKDLQQATISGGGVPMLIATDQEGGSVTRINTGTPMPGNMSVAATNNTTNAKTAAGVISQELDALAYNTTLAPDVDINSNPGNPIIGTRSFSDDPETVANFTLQYLEGLEVQNTVGCLKHYGGHGDTDTDSHTGCPLVNKTWDELLNFELVPFKRSIDNNADMIMTAHIIYPQVDNSKITATKGTYAGQEVGTPATLSHILLTEKLKGELGFDGVICSDSMGMAGVSSILNTNDRNARAINAGVDLLCMPLVDEDMKNPTLFKDNMDALINYIEANVSADRIEDAVKRILTLKEKKGILDYDASKYTQERALETVGNSTFKQQERDIAADGVTLVKNANQTLPVHFNPNTKVLFLVQDHNGAKHESFAAQFVYGWNRAKEVGLIPQGASFEVVMFDQSDWQNADKLTAIDNADYIFTNSIVGNKTNMAYKKFQTAAPKKYTDYAKSKGKKSIVISLNNPYDVQYFDSADAILATYNLSGSQDNWEDVLASGATYSNYAMGANLPAAIEVSFGVYGAQGKLPVNIYKFDANSDSYDLSEIIYERGFGLEYDPITSMDKTDINLEFNQAEYTGQEIRPQVTVSVEKFRTSRVLDENNTNLSSLDALDSENTDRTKVLTENVDYSLEYLNNIDIGTATVNVNGMGSYVGSKSVDFEIVEKGSLANNGDDKGDLAGSSSKTSDALFILMVLGIVFALSFFLFRHINHGTKHT